MKYSAFVSRGEFPGDEIFEERARMETSIIDTSNPPDVVISDENVKRFCRGLKDFFSNGCTDDLGYFKENKAVLNASINSDGLKKVWLNKGKSLAFSVQPFDCEYYDFDFLHDDKSGCMVLGPIFRGASSRAIPGERKRKALVQNILTPALADLGF